MPKNVFYCTFQVSRIKVLKILFILLLIATISKVMDKKKLTYRPRNVTIAQKCEENVSTNTIGKVRYCTFNFEDSRKLVFTQQSLPIIYFLTPTYPRPEQYPLLIRLSHTLMHVPRIFWIVADDNAACSGDVASILKRSRLPYVHISSPKFKKTIAAIRNNKSKTSNKSRHVPARGVANRIAALRWLQASVKDGILYFGDDDNTYDLKLFNEIRKTKKLSMLPVGLIGNYGFSAPLLGKGKVIGFLDSWPAGRKFPIDMAGFAVNIKHLRGKNLIRVNSEGGMVEDIFLRTAGFDLKDIEPLATNCSKILAWHTQVIKNAQANSRLNLKKLGKSALAVFKSSTGIINSKHCINETMLRFVIWSTQAELYSNFAQLYKTKI